MPVLAGGRIVGKIDPARRDGALLAKHVSLDSESAVPAVAKALIAAAAWIGTDTVIVEKVDPPGAAAAFKSALG
jgi:hypothetical protein